MLFSNYSCEEFKSNFSEVIQKWSFEDILNCYRSLCIVVDSDNFSNFPFADEVIYAMDCIIDYVFKILDDDNLLNALKSALSCSND